MVPPYEGRSHPFSLIEKWKLGAKCWVLVEELLDCLNHLFRNQQELLTLWDRFWHGFVAPYCFVDLFSLVCYIVALVNNERYIALPLHIAVWIRNMEQSSQLSFSIVNIPARLGQKGVTPVASHVALIAAFAVTIVTAVIVRISGYSMKNLWAHIRLLNFQSLIFLELSIFYFQFFQATQ